MRRTFAIAISASLVLAACSGTTSARKEDPLSNPLVAKQHFDDLGQTMVDILLHDQKDLTNDAAKKSYVEQVKDLATQRSKDASARITAGRVGSLVPMKQTVAGTALLAENTLFLSVDFATDPGPSLHLYLTKAVDPRDVAFPDASAVDLGLLRTEYGAQAYAVPRSGEYNSVALYDTRLKLLYGLAQLAK